MPIREASMKPGFKQAHDDDDEAVGSTMRPRRRRLDPRLDEIAERARTGQLTEQQALEQMVQVLGESMQGKLPEESRIGVMHVLRELVNDPKIIAQLNDDE
jgi:hypothetical protein